MTAFVSIPIVAADDLSSLDKALVIGVLIFSLVVVVVLCRLEVMVSDGQVVASFGPGWPRRIVALETVAAARQVRNRWWHGIGIRKMPQGWMFSVWGLDAVELELSSGKVFRIGTDDPGNLLGALSVRLNS